MVEVEGLYAFVTDIMIVVTLIWLNGGESGSLLVGSSNSWRQLRPLLGLRSNPCCSKSASKKEYRARTLDHNHTYPESCEAIFRHASVSSTYPCKLVGWSVTLSDFQSLASNGRSNQKVKKKQSPSIFEFCFWKDPPHPQKCI